MVAINRIVPAASGLRLSIEMQDTQETASSSEPPCRVFNHCTNLWLEADAHKVVCMLEAPMNLA
jgi:hypothetical protein